MVATQGTLPVVGSTNAATNAQKVQLCENQRYLGMAVGGGVGGLITYGLHNWMSKNAPTYNTMGQASKYIAAAAIIGISGFEMGQYMQNRCRKQEGLPPV
jgi:hypothetical protein